MLTEYETGFTILKTSELAGTALLADVADRLETILSDEQSDGSPSITEREISASSGYAIIGADRLHPLDPEHTLRLQVRLCTEGQAVTAQIRSRFISADEYDPADLTAGPPHILHKIVESYSCEIGTYQFRNEVFLVEDVPTAQRVMSFVTNPGRKIPVLVLTDDPNGDTAIEPQLAFDYLLGLALIVHFRGDTSSCIGGTPGISACYNGAMRFFWPGGSVSKFYWPDDAANNDVSQFQKDCLENADLQDLNGDFEDLFSKARTRVIREQRIAREQAAQSETAARLAQATDRIAELEHQAGEVEAKHSRTVDELLEQLNNVRTNSTSDSEKDKEIRRLNTAINQWKRRLRHSDESNKELKEMNRELEERLEHAEADAAAAKILTIAETDADDSVLLTGNSHIDNITVLNHAINIYRNPGRRYIIRSLRKRYDNLNDLYNAIERTMNSDDDRKRLREAATEKNLQDGIDVGHFEHIVMDNRACFGEKPRLSTRMSYVRQVRNAAAHPKYSGIDVLEAKDGINKISGALREMGNNDYGKLVERLLPLVR